jgi:hypothetical protein
MRWLAVLVVLVAPVAAEPVSKLRELSLRVGGIAKVSERECTFEIAERSLGLRTELTIPLRGVVWTVQLDADGRTLAKATCRKDDCIKGRMEGRTLDVPHQFFWEKASRDTYAIPLGTMPVREAGHVVTALRDAPQLCKKSFR